MTENAIIVGLQGLVDEMGNRNLGLMEMISSLSHDLKELRELNAELLLALKGKMNAIDWEQRKKADEFARAVIAKAEKLG
jgi:hypothetical protein